MVLGHLQPYMQGLHLTLIVCHFIHPRDRDLDALHMMLLQCSYII